MSERLAPPSTARSRSRRRTTAPMRGGPRGASTVPPARSRKRSASAGSTAARSAPRPAGSGRPAGRSRPAARTATGPDRLGRHDGRSGAGRAGAVPRRRRRLPDRGRAVFAVGGCRGARGARRQGRRKVSAYERTPPSPDNRCSAKVSAKSSPAFCKCMSHPP